MRSVLAGALRCADTCATDTVAVGRGAPDSDGCFVFVVDDCASARFTCCERSGVVECRDGTSHPAVLDCSARGGQRVPTSYRRGDL